jgi:hypothetical protein
MSSTDSANLAAMAQAIQMLCDWQGFGLGFLAGCVFAAPLLIWRVAKDAVSEVDS